MTDPTKPGLLDRTREGMQAVKADVFANVPPVVVERIGEKARLGIALITAAMGMTCLLVWLVMRVKDPSWQLLAVLLAIPGFVALIGANLVSQKVTQAALGSIGAVWRGIKGQTPTNGGNGG